MRRWIVTLALLGLVGIGVVLAPRLEGGARVEAPSGVAQSTVAPEQTPDPTQAERPRIELVFALDTTSSMSGLIDGAKDTIWSMINDFSSQRPVPEIRVGLVAYRDRGDSYVTEIFPLTGDLDAVYGKLMQLQAEGGGDTPESVGRALQEAVRSQPWTTDRARVYRAIFLVGDAPDKGYGDEPTPLALASEARQRNIYVSAVQCGEMSETKLEFTRIAGVGGGTFSAVAQDGAVERIETPMDGRLDQLERELSQTALLWGAPAEKDNNFRKIQGITGSSASTNAARRSALKKGKDTIITSEGKGDLLDDLKEKKVALEALREEEKPDDLKGLDEAAMKAELAARSVKRDELQAEIARLVAERDQWLAEERARKSAEGTTRYDREVVEKSIEQLKALGYIE